MKKKRNILILIASVVLIALLITAKKKGWIGSDPNTFEVEVEKVALRDIYETVSASGKVQPEVVVKISPEVSGEIFELPKLEGDKVSKGELLVKINPDLYQAAVARTEAATNTAKANLLQAEAQFIEAENNYKRNEQLFKKGAISATEFDAFKRGYEVAKLSIEAARYQLKSAQATEKEAKDNLRRTTIYSPIDGTLSKLNVEVGERVVGTAQMAGTELLRIADLNNMEVLIEVNENDINKIKLNDSAYVEVEAVSDRKFRGVVTRIANSSISRLNESATDQVSNFEVRIRIDKSSYEDLIKEDGLSPFRPGMSATVEIFTQLAKSALSVPVQAVTLRSDTTGKSSSRSRSLNDEEFECVFVVQEGKAQLRKVKIGIQDDKYFEIKEGLSENDEIVSGPYAIISQKLHTDASLKTKKKDKE